MRLLLHGIFQARILEWVAISFSRRSSRPRDCTRVSRIVGFTALLSEPPGKSQINSHAMANGLAESGVRRKKIRGQGSLGKRHSCGNGHEV